MFTTWTDENLVIERDLTTTYTRELVTGPTIRGTDDKAIYFKYTRVRDMRFKYVGLTREAAYNCAADMRAIFRRKYLPQIWHDGGAGHYGWSWPVNSTILDYKVVDVATVAEPRLKDGEQWEVDVTLYEPLEYNHTAIKETSDFPETAIFAAFEMDPNGKHGCFVGGYGNVAGEDYWYPGQAARDALDEILLYRPTRWTTRNSSLATAVEINCRNYTSIDTSKLWGQFYADGAWLNGSELKYGFLNWSLQSSDSRPTKLRIYYPGDDSHGYIVSNEVEV